jgi:hypothetical protein
MVGYPRRHQPARRSGPAQVLFDPSGDDSCAIWVRADTGVTYDAGTNIITGFGSQVGGRFLAAADNSKWVRFPQLTNGFDGALTTVGQYTVSDLGNGANVTAASTTIVFRSLCYSRPAEWGGNDWFAISPIWRVSVRHWDGPRFGFLVNGGVNDWASPMAPVWWNGATFIYVVTVRFAYDGTQVRFTYSVNGATYVDGSIATGYHTITPTTVLSMSGGHESYRLGFHELIHTNRFITDAELSSMHNLLRQQYSQQ